MIVPKLCVVHYIFKSVSRDDNLDICTLGKSGMISLEEAEEAASDFEDIFMQRSSHFVFYELSKGYTSFQSPDQ